ncbi:hypothetical protein Ddye_019727 [Dipteronia dyeriana]|uniref:Protein kinase domain-containing protein n=1 Tax=Dipteronia dyeriana TaxID=168575 RepID=A0AAD9TYY6_9ROSI|nr:hypothetical protein Ddye_019727 [Dipteronia dyeriana]
MEWTRGRTIGRGSTAIVSIATDNGSGQVFAVKSSQLSNSEFLQREERILSTLTSPHIVAYKGCGISSENGGSMYNLFLEYARGGTVADEIRERGGGLDDGSVRSYTRAMLLGLEYLHCNGVAHCDIKSQNVLVAGDGAKIADFGCAKRVCDDVSSSDSAPQIMGTPLYMAPEVARGEEQLFPADVWALGCTVIEMVTGRPPWVGLSDPVTALYRIGFSGDVPEIPKNISKQAKDFVVKCLIKDPRERWSASELLKHEFVDEPSSFLRVIYDYNQKTPTSVLNQGFWNSMEDGLLETTWNSKHEENRSSCSSSPLDRIQQLSGENSKTSILNWTFDETWVTVRTNGSEEKQGLPPLMINHDHNHNRDMSWTGEVRRASDLDSPQESIKISEIITCNTSSVSNGSSSHDIFKILVIALAPSTGIWVFPSRRPVSNKACPPELRCPLSTAKHLVAHWNCCGGRRGRVGTRKGDEEKGTGEGTGREGMEMGLTSVHWRWCDGLMGFVGEEINSLEI